MQNIESLISRNNGKFEYWKGGILVREVAGLWDKIASLDQCKMCLTYDEPKPGGILGSLVKGFNFFPDFECRKRRFWDQKKDYVKTRSGISRLMWLHLLIISYLLATKPLRLSGRYAQRSTAEAAWKLHCKTKSLLWLMEPDRSPLSEQPASQRKGSPLEAPGTP